MKYTTKYHQTEAYHPHPHNQDDSFNDITSYGNQ